MWFLLNPELNKLKLGHPFHAAEISAWLPMTVKLKMEKLRLEFSVCYD